MGCICRKVENQEISNVELKDENNVKEDDQTINPVSNSKDNKDNVKKPVNLINNLKYSKTKIF